jgi:hypothetical protein
LWYRDGALTPIDHDKVDLESQAVVNKERSILAGVAQRPTVFIELLEVKKQMKWFRLLEPLRDVGFY